ncbi:13866_t:CDS:1 [Acaulospora morrowiae]|uniref:Phosphatidylglycerol/phosphatidylinositol transfer protein n=1 Tax=Acaulospora morrowiae TaxID=94023 RepID=A0A9N9AFL0_9GLOM|nr:13866_t:CDS:1 [Acaulospora morrowiae]
MLTIINANSFRKRATLFGPCPNINDTFSVKMDPDPLFSPHLVTFTLSGEETSGRNIDPLSSVVVTIGAEFPVQPPSTFLACNSTDCPLFSGDPYTTSGTFLLNASLPPSYQIIFTIGNINSSSPQIEFQHDITLACAMATVTSS